MDDQTYDDLAAIAGQLKEHLKFYRDIGVADIGGCSRPDSTATFAETTVMAAPEEAESHPQPLPEPPREESPVLQEFNLFGEPVSPPPGSKSAGRTAQPPQILAPPLDASLEAIREDIGDCTRCKLSEHRTNIVFGEGNPHARLVFIGEGPGADEDATGRPFVGRAGQLLDKIIVAIGLRREDVYIANVVKCRPPGNRTPEKDETATCEPFLFRQLRFINPRVIVTLGLPALQSLLKVRDSITRARGQWREWNGVRVMPTFHPAYLLRDPSKKREVWEDIRKVRDYLVEEKLL
ncbi:MAG TPA: uracil-DNA glycosylase [Blastocatellia bacterium]|jgi:uracil-DNA glycosylase family 4|nr:uracil-DNA glycosylase [Blastocatellia bacterium]